MSTVPVIFDANKPHVGTVNWQKQNSQETVLLYTQSMSPLLDDDVKWVRTPPNHPHIPDTKVEKLETRLVSDCPLCGKSGCIEADTDKHYTNAEGEQTELKVLHCLTVNTFAFT